MSEPISDINNNKTRNDYLFFQNEILTDLKKMELRINEKISKITSFLSEEKNKNDSKIQEFTSKFDELQIKKIEFTEQINNSLNSLKLKQEEYASKNEIRISMIQKDLSNACFKYDKVLINNLTIPNLVGECCPYANLPIFIEFANNKINDLLTSRDKKNMDYKRYKEKLESLIGQNKLQFETIENKFNDLFNTRIKECEDKFETRLNITEERIEHLRLENGKYALDLIKKTDELKLELNKLQDFENMLDINFKRELEKYYELNESLLKNFEKYREEFNVIKVKFTELNEFVKDIRFKKSLKNLIDEKQSYKNIKEKIHYKKQKIKGQEKYNNDLIFYNNSCNEDINNNNVTIKYENIQNVDNMNNNNIINKFETIENIDNMNNNIVNEYENIKNFNNMSNNIANKFENTQNSKIMNNNNEIIENRKGNKNKTYYNKIEIEENIEKNNKSKNKSEIANKKQKINQNGKIFTSVNINKENDTQEIYMSKSFNGNFKSYRPNNNFANYNQSYENNNKNKNLDKNINKNETETNKKSKNFSNSPKLNNNNNNNNNLKEHNFSPNQFNDFTNSNSMYKNNKDNFNNNINQYNNFSNSNIIDTNNNSSRNTNIIKINNGVLNNNSNNINFNYKTSRHFRNNKKINDIKYNCPSSKLLKEYSNINVNNLILDADLDGASPSVNLNHAYVFVKKKNDNLQNLNIYYGNNNTFHNSNRKTDKFLPLSPVNFDKNIFKNPNFLFNKNYSKSNLEDLYYTKRKKERIKELINNNGTSEINKEQINEDSNKNNLPRLVLTPTSGNYPDNLSDNLFNKGCQKKLQKSSSDAQLPIRVCIKVNGGEIIEREGGKNNLNFNQQILNKLNPFLMKKFKE